MMPQIEIGWRSPQFTESTDGSVAVSELGEVVSQAIFNARGSFAANRHVSILSRLDVIQKFRARLARDAASIARNLSGESQRSPEEFLASEVIPLLDACRFLEKNAVEVLHGRSYGRWSMPLWLSGTRHEIIREPLGVVLIIGASNYPLFLPGVQLLQAFVAGNAALLKPAPGGVHSAQTLLDLLANSRAPEGLIQSLPFATNSAGHTIARKVDKVFFTGSAETGRKVLIHAATALTPAVMELSGCDATFVLRDADLDLAARSIAYGLTLNSGRTCIAPRRAFVSRDVLETFSAKLKFELQKRPITFFKQSPSSDFIGNVFDALSNGAQVLHGAVTRSGAIEGPLVLSNVEPEMPFATAENWGPNLSIIPVNGEEEALRFNQRSLFALGASIFTRDQSVAQRMARTIQAGSVCINDLVVPTADGRLPFSGRKSSGFGATRGREGLLEMTVPKVISTRIGGTPLHLRPTEKNQIQLLSAYCGLAYGTARERWKAFRTLVKTLINRDTAQPKVSHE